MKKQTKEDIIQIILAIYKVPGQYTIIALFSFAFWNALRFTGPLSITLLFLGVFCIFLEVISPIIAGKRIYDNSVKNIKRFLKK